MTTLYTGDRVALGRDLDRHPHFVAEKGLLGTVTFSTMALVKVRLDAELPGAEHWQNEIYWYHDEMLDETAISLALDDLDVISRATQVCMICRTPVPKGQFEDSGICRYCRNPDFEPGVQPPWRKITLTIYAEPSFNPDLLSELAEDLSDRIADWPGHFTYETQTSEEISWGAIPEDARKEIAEMLDVP